MLILPIAHIQHIAQASPQASFRVPDNCNKLISTTSNGLKSGIVCSLNRKTGEISNVRLDIEAPEGKTLQQCSVKSSFPKPINTGLNPQTGQKVFATQENEVFQIGGKSKYSINDFGESDGTATGIVQPSAISFQCELNGQTQAAPLTLLPNIYKSKQEKKPPTVKVSGSFDIPSQCGSTKKGKKVQVTLNCPNKDNSNQEKKGLGASLELQTINSNETIYSCNFTTNYAQRAYLGLAANGAYLSGTEDKTPNISIQKSSYSTYSLNGINLNSVIAQNAGYTSSTSEMSATRVRYSCEIQTQPSAKTLPSWQQTNAPYRDLLTTPGVGLTFTANKLAR